MPVFRLFFIMLTACAGFLMMTGTVVGVGLGIIELFNIPYRDDGPRMMIFAVVALFFFWFLRFIVRIFGGVTKGLVSQSNTEATQKEARIMQDLHQGMTKMEQRVESLETLLIDRTRDESHGPSYRY